MTCWYVYEEDLWGACLYAYEMLEQYIVYSPKIDSNIRMKYNINNIYYPEYSELFLKYLIY